MATDGWYPPALDNRAPKDGGSHLGPVTIGVLHTTESTRFYPARENYFGHSSYPHFTCVVVGRVFFAYQHISLRRAARALKNLSGGVQTNRQGVIQIEVVGSATRPFTDDPVMVAGLKDLMRWIESQTEIKPRSTVNWIAYPKSYGENAKQRLSHHQWNHYNGWLGHQHVPENDHGDPGAIDIGSLLLLDPIIEEEETPTMFLCKDPRSNKQYLLSGNTRKEIKTWDAFIQYRDAKKVPVIELDAAELDSYPDVTR